MKARPVRTTNIPKVMIIGGTLNLATPIPFTVPNSSPSMSAATNGTKKSPVMPIKAPQILDEKKYIAPVLRSIPPDSITIVWANARMPNTERSQRKKFRYSIFQNFGCNTLASVKIIRNIARIDSVCFVSGGSLLILLLVSISASV
jgi:hypothetical protein